MNILTYLDFELIKLLYKENTLSQRAQWSQLKKLALFLPF